MSRRSKQPPSGNAAAFIKAPCPNPIAQQLKEEFKSLWAHGEKKARAQVLRAAGWSMGKEKDFIRWTKDEARWCVTAIIRGERIGCFMSTDISTAPAAGQN